MKTTFTLDNINTIAIDVISKITNKTILFYGEMGVGKTTLIKELAKVLGVTETISSPTFSIVNEYEAENDLLYHFDCYRIVDESEALDFGIEEYLYSGRFVFIEWPEKIKDLLPEQVTKIKITKNKDDSRTLNITPVK